MVLIFPKMNCIAAPKGGRRKIQDGAFHRLGNRSESSFITSDANGPKHLYYKLSRAKLEELVRDLIEKSITLVKQVLSDAKMSASDIEEVVLVGGQTRMPFIQEEVKKLFGKEPNKSINPVKLLRFGAAVEAGILQGEVKDVLLLDVTPLSLGIETMGGV